MIMERGSQINRELATGSMFCRRVRGVRHAFYASTRFPYSTAGLTNVWHACPFLDTRHSLLPHFFFISFAQPSSLYCEVFYIYIYISDCVEIVCDLPLLPKNTACETFLHKSVAVRSVDWLFIIGAPFWR